MPSPCSTFAAADQIVVSVGPYIFQTEADRLHSSRASSGGKASPPHNTFNGGSPFQPASRSCCHVTGVACIIVARTVLINSSRVTPYCAISRVARANVAPTQSGANNSSAEMSNDNVVTAAKTSLGEMPGDTATDCSKLDTALWGTSTPFGCPVDPDV